ncbi:hypothetical protein J2W28_006948 [Variovorax boronicumulans]|uniref:hypothetical protein n=1 Tax=Variovorax boronicumulans TaxID=436515 RepID=UPI0027857F7A|nr:hypothetical protein [Variovorax boronicumulans]MDP9996473.1 hypothetical protein [Variovorax boronicumulans]MDQ0007769.1 hypothetical protein [Variovorax boronicumulans]
MRRSVFVAIVVTLAVAGCGATGVQPIGNGVYMTSKLGSMVTFNGGEVKAELYKEAADYCAQRGKKSIPVNSTSKDSGLGTYASAEVQFRCE